MKARYAVGSKHQIQLEWVDGFSVRRPVIVARRVKVENPDWLRRKSGEDHHYEYHLRDPRTGKVFLYMSEDCFAAAKLNPLAIVLNSAFDWKF